MGRVTEVAPNSLYGEQISKRLELRQCHLLSQLRACSGDPVHNEVELASQYLIEASHTRGSPQLDSFGPRFELAEQLLQLGQRDIVIAYVQNCANW